MSHKPFGRAFILAALVLPVCTLAPRAVGQHAARRTRVLVLYQQQAETQPMLEFTEPLREAIRKELGATVEFYQESLDLDRVSGREHSSPLTNYFDDKYRGFGIDVVVPVGGRALDFATDHLRDVLPGVPIVFALCAEPQTNPASQPENVTGRIAPASRFASTLWMARRLQPDAEQIVVIGGAGAADSVSVAAAVSAAAAMGGSLPLTVVQGLSLDVLLPKLRQLPARSIVVFANYRYDGRGQPFEPQDIVGSIARAASAPMYAQLNSYVGEGVVGGSVLRFDDEGDRTGRLVVRVLRRRAGERMPPVEPIAKSFVADWRQLRRFDLREALLPAGTTLVFREPTLWQRHRMVVLLTLALISAELLLISRLLLERRRRKRAQLDAEEQQRRAEVIKRQVAHMGRVALVGELATTMSHELRQSLTAVRANAETGAKLIVRNTGEFDDEERELCGHLFRAIVADNALASDIITRVRALVRREELPKQPVDLNDVCRTSARLLQHDAATRRAEITLALDPRTPIAIGDPVHFQQVVLNLTLNALDASVESTPPQVTIRTDARQEEVEIAVYDNGRGLSADVQQHLFESFFTTKSHGLGLGLAIVQSIIERHNGRVRGENGDRGGAIFRVVLPRAQGPPITLSGAAETIEGRHTGLNRGLSASRGVADRV